MDKAGGDSKLVLGLAIGSAYTRSATATAACFPKEGGREGEKDSGFILNRPEIVVNADGDRGTATLVALRKEEQDGGGKQKEGEWLVGAAAKTAMGGRYASQVQSWGGMTILQALLGEKKEDEEDEEEEEEEVVDEEEEGREEKVGMEEVCSQLLQHVIEQAENSSGECPSECVLAIPSWCTEEHRGAAIHALNMAGLSVLGVIREPLATLLAFRQNEGEVGGEGGKEEGRYIVIYDLGHSHCDVSVVREDAQGFYQLLHSSSSPPSSLPPSTPARGEAFVDRLVSLCCADFRKKAGCDATESKRAIAKLKKECENALKTLSTSTTVDIEIDSLYEGFDLRTRITRARFESEIFDILKACISAVEAALAAAGVAKEDVGLLLLAGGASRVPKLQQWLQASFLSPAGSTRIKSVDTNPEEGVALGAALQAQLLSQAAAAASSSSSSAGGSGDAHPFTHSLTTSPLSFGLLVTDLPTEEGGKEGGMTTAFFKSFLKHASIASSAKSKIGDRQPFFLIHQGEFLPASQRVRVKKSANDQADISLHVVAAGSEGPVEEGGEESVLTLAEITYRAPEGDQTEEWDLTMTLAADGVLRVRLQEKDGGQVLRDVVIRAKKEAQN